LEIRDLIAGASAAFSIFMGLFATSRAKSTATTAVAVEKALTAARMDALEKRIVELEGDLAGVKTGLELGIGRLQDSVIDVARTLQELKTDVAVLADRDERPIRRRRPTTKAVA
jgi:hypothetical protein